MGGVRMTGAQMMTWIDFYDTLVVLSFVGLAAMGIVWCALKWRAHRERRAALERYRLSPAFREFENEMRKVQRTIGTAMIGPASRMAEQLAALARSFDQVFPARPGTVQNPRSDATTPRELSRP